MAAGCSIGGVQPISVFDAPPPKHRGVPGDTPPVHGPLPGTRYCSHQSDDRAGRRRAPEDGACPHQFRPPARYAAPVGVCASTAALLGGVPARFTPLGVRHPPGTRRKFRPMDADRCRSRPPASGHTFRACRSGRVTTTASSRCAAAPGDSRSLSRRWIQTYCPAPVRPRRRQGQHGRPFPQ